MCAAETDLLASAMLQYRVASRNLENAREHHEVRRTSAAGRIVTVINYREQSCGEERSSRNLPAAAYRRAVT